MKHLFKVTLNSALKTSDHINLYLETSPSEVGYHLDNVVMEKWEADGAWRDEANTRIEEKRKRNIQMNFPNIDATGLTINYQQLTQGFPFGHAVISDRISDCQVGNQEWTEYCEYVADNYNWIVDTYRWF